MWCAVVSSCSHLSVLFFFLHINFFAVVLSRNIDTTQTTKQQPAYIKFRIKTGNKEPACLTHIMYFQIFTKPEVFKNHFVNFGML